MISDQIRASANAEALIVYNGLAHNNFYCMSLSVAECRNYIAFDRITVNCYALDTLIDMRRIGNLDIISSTTELTCCSKTIPCSRDRRINLQTVEVC